ncbi:MAG TPA: hypothetical protein VIA06_06230 [Candidatus Dormibacteraeota bacterium]|jgi:hypothetical protein|nr:hypothetical protein [Candidatus Dormibacteraeota bacterium]
MRGLLFEEEPEPDEEPDEPDAPAAGPAAAIPSIAGENREFEYRTEVLTTVKLTDGKTLAKVLNEASKDGWDFVKVLSAADQHVVLLRKAKSAARSDRRVGFAIGG